VNHWTFDTRIGGSRRFDGVYFYATTNYTHDVTPSNGPDWVWLVHWPDPILPAVWIDPVKRGLDTPADVEAYIDA
jgi:hypothetical protein